MCGIFFSLNSSSSVEFIKLQYDLGKSRGPESSNYIIVNNIFMGFHRLAINGLSPESNQPF